MSETPQEFGARFEREFAEVVGGNVTPASGATFHTKLDVKDSVIRWSAKATTKKSFTITQDHIAELDKAAYGSGGTGATTISGMAIRIGTPEFDVVLLRASDFVRLMTERSGYIKESKAEAKRAIARTPILFRED